jgi:hypothetical protein
MKFLESYTEEFDIPGYAGLKHDLFVVPMDEPGSFLFPHLDSGEVYHAEEFAKDLKDNHDIEMKVEFIGGDCIGKIKHHKVEERVKMFEEFSFNKKDS